MSEVARAREGRNREIDYEIYTKNLVEKKASVSHLGHTLDIKINTIRVASKANIKNEKMKNKNNVKTITYALQSAHKYHIICVCAHSQFTMFRFLLTFARVCEL